LRGKWAGKIASYLLYFSSKVSITASVRGGLTAGELSIQHEEADTTLLSGNIPDQPALYGILSKLNQIGITRLSVEADKLHTSGED
jgi:hypothetical protein